MLSMRSRAAKATLAAVKEMIEQECDLNQLNSNGVAMVSGLDPQLTGNAPQLCNEAAMKLHTAELGEWETKLAPQVTW